MKPSSVKAKGRSAEQSVCDFLAGTLFPMAERRRLNGVYDKGDIAGTHPDLCWEVKGAKDIALSEWLGELAEEKFNARAQYGFLIIKPPGYGPAKIEQWWALVPSGEYFTLCRHGSFVPLPIGPWRSLDFKNWMKRAPVVSFEVRKGRGQVVLMPLSELVALLYAAGYGRETRYAEAGQHRIVPQRKNGPAERMDSGGNP